MLGVGAVISTGIVIAGTAIMKGVKKTAPIIAKGAIKIMQYLTKYQHAKQIIEYNNWTKF